MNPPSPKTRSALALVIGGFLCAGPVLADPPGWAKGKGKGHSEERRGDRHDGDRVHPSSGPRHFGERHIAMVRDYYTEEFRGGRCPPGLAKKKNGCMPPGQAKKWRMGRPLPPDVVWYEVPQPLLVQIGPAPSGHRYVRIAGDILMIAVGSGMVVDAIRDLGRI